MCQIIPRNEITINIITLAGTALMHNVKVRVGWLNNKQREAINARMINSSSII